MALIWDKSVYDQFYSKPLWKYGVRGSPRVPYGHYTWYGQREAVQRMVDAYMAQPGFAQVNNLCFVGGGFCWTGEYLRDNHGVNVASVDTSPYIHATKDASEEAEIRADLQKFGFDPDNLPGLISPLNPNETLLPGEVWNYWLRPDGKRTSVTVIDEDLSTNNSRRNVRNALPSNMDAIITEFVLDAYEAGDDAGSMLLAERCEQLRPNPNCNVIHIVEPNSAAGEGFPLNNHTMAEWRTLLDANGFTDHVLINFNGERF